MDKKIEQEQISQLSKILAGRPYKPVSKISYGSYGEIFKIIGTQMNKEYALKVISKERMLKQQKLHQAIIQNILLKNLEHPGIIKYFESIESSQYICHVIQLCPFGDLNQVFKKIDKSLEMCFIKEEIIIFYLAQVVEALDFLHKKKIIHRDLKLENILVGGDLNCRIIDFGTAKAIQQQRTYSKSQLQFIAKIRESYNNSEEQINRTKSFVGSANYLAPESIKLEYTLKSDIWSLGILIYKIFHGKLPFRGQNNFQIFNEIKNHDTQSLKINPSLSKQIHDIIVICLSPDPSKRPSTAELKKHPYFSKVNFETIFTKKAPVDMNALKNTDIKPEKNLQKIQFQIKLQKQMFLGNYKPRILKIYPNKTGNKIFMSYWYLDGNNPKNQFELRLGDHAEKSSKNEFTVINGDVKYKFRVKDGPSVQEIVDKINLIIMTHHQNA